MLSPHPEGAGVSRQGRYELAGTVVTAETGNFQPFPSAWKKPKGQQGQQFATSQFETAANRYTGKRKGFNKAPDIQDRKHRVLCQELDRNWRLSCRGWARCFLSKPETGPEQISVSFATKGRTLQAQLWPQSVT